MNTQLTQPGAAEQARSIDTLRVVLVGGDGRWVGTFAEFLSDNEDAFTLLEIERMADTLRAGRRWMCSGGAAPVMTLRREPTAAEIIEALPTEWLACLPGFGVRHLAANEEKRTTDFQFTGHCGEEVHRALYLARNPSDSYYIAKSFRYIREVHPGEGFFADADETEVLALLDEQCEMGALLERLALGSAVAEYRQAKEVGATEDELRAKAVACDQAMGAMKFTRCGAWWDSKHGTWGLGALDEDELLDGAIISGPHC